MWCSSGCDGVIPLSLCQVPDLVPSKRGVLFARIKAVTALSALARSRKRLLDYGVNTDTAFSVTMKSIQEGTAGADCSNIMQRLHDDDVTRAVAELGETHRLRYLKALLAATSSPEEERLKKEKEERQKEQDALLAGRSNVTGIGASVIKRQDSKENQVDDDEIQQVDKQQMASALLGSTCPPLHRSHFPPWKFHFPPTSYLLPSSSLPPLSQVSLKRSACVCWMCCRTHLAQVIGCSCCRH